MMLGLNMKNGEKHFLSSWKTEDDPSPEKFVCGITPETSPQAFIWNGSKPYSRSASAGTVNIKRWDEQVKRWHVGWNVLVHPCDTYEVCGPSGLCNRDRSPNCECLKGFVPNSTEDRRKGNWAGGCVRNNELLCQKNTTSLASSGKAHNDGFWKLTSMKLQDHYEYLYNEDSSGCQQWSVTGWLSLETKTSCPDFYPSARAGSLTLERGPLLLLVRSSGGFGARAGISPIQFFLCSVGRSSMGLAARAGL
ncbi:hypothetical protein HYC85_017801 [Camellia sinensis]|uniref:S-locus glycoprotein domain-containing protein n=1 Tax=Camellia sinensis TaxID=4442 RepID=A0A7J7GW90_CAMSI|nr:hypothetical protein HYC85_017801 [Camellia sinensis]